jgi:hypothetical protein
MEDVQNTASLSSPAPVRWPPAILAQRGRVVPSLTDLLQDLRAGVWLPARKWSNAQVVQMPYVDAGIVLAGTA